MILRIVMILSIVSYERKNTIFYEQNLNLRKNNYFNNIFFNSTFSYCRFLPIFFLNVSILKNHGLFLEKTFILGKTNILIPDYLMAEIVKTIC